MPDGVVVTIARDMLVTSLILALPPLGFGLVVGLVVSVFQALTQIHDQTLVFVPKIIAVAVVLILFMPFMLKVMLDYTNELFAAFNYFAAF
ncbi:flagellar biosynthesis protein FliQ [bacterium]|nr:flagellar biosynthesis protein FliQ [bacterium]